MIEPGIINSNSGGVITISSDVWEDYNLENLESLSMDQILSKITEFIADLNNTYLRNRKNADGNQVTLSNTAMISAKKLTTDYSAASAGNADVKVAMANNINDLNEVFANQRIVALESNNAYGSIPTGMTTVASLLDSDDSDTLITLEPL